MPHFRLVAGVCLLLGLVLFAVPTFAQVSGQCSNCHTMHNSQSGSAVAETWDGDSFESAGPLDTLLKSDCVGCHSSTEAATIQTIGSTKIPIVYSTGAEPQYPADGSNNSSLAGGNFYWVAQPDGDAYGHNVLGISGQDGDLVTPPGNSAGAGCLKCHKTLSDPDVASEETGCRACHVPHHHADDSATVVGATGGWYRFLGDNPEMGAATQGVIGIEDSNWEQNPSSSVHNVYQGTTTNYKQDIPLKENSIGEFCAGCHGQFHHEMNTGQPSNNLSGAWIRHPSDVVIPNSGEYAGYTVYNALAPVAESSDLAVAGAPGDYTVVSPGSDVVTCISCHRPHGSPYPDMLRWDYNSCSNPSTGEGPCGCYVCHTTKD